MTTQSPHSPFSWLRRSRAALDVIVSSPDAAARAARALQTDRTAAASAMGVRLAEVLGTVFNEVYSPTPGNRVHLLLAGTGTGKTSHTLASIAADPRTYEWDGREDNDAYPGPVVFLLPTYANIVELRGKAEVLDLNPSLSGKRLAAAARARGIIHVSEVEAYVAAMSDKRLVTEIYKGKVAAGCKRPAEITQLMDAGLPSSRLCTTGAAQCPFYDTCGAITQRQRMKRAHVVFAPRSFLDLRLPEEIEKVRLLVADEAVWPLLVHSATFPLSTLDLVRDAPKLSSDEDMSAGEMLGQRALAGAVVKSALLAGTDPAQALRDHVVDVPGIGGVAGLLTHSAGYAAKITGAAVVDRATISPWMSPRTIARICAVPTGQHIGDEHRMWSMIADRLEDGEVGHDVRIQLLGRDTENPMIRLSWLSSPNWGSVPTLLLDASGDEEITKRVFPGREIVVHELPVDFNQRVLACIDRRFAMRTICPGPGATPLQLFEAARMLHEIRCVISAICGVHAYGRVLIGMPKKIRKAVQSGWMPPLNADLVHFGATAGLDFARQHVAIVSIGRMEVPISELDAQVAALTASDGFPEAPIDVFGTGLDGEGKAIYPHIVTRTLQMRDGSDLHYLCHEHAGEMARRVQHQHREHNVLQLIGRGRSFYRTDTVVVYVIGQAVPESLVIDEVCSWEDLVGSGASMWEVVRQAGGVLSPELMSRANPSSGTIDRYRGWIDRLPETVLEGYHGVRAKLRVGGGVRDIGIPGHVDELVAFIAGTPRMAGDIDLEDISWSPLTAPAAPEGRPADDIETRLGDRRARGIAERLLVRKARQLVQRRGEWRPGAGTFRAGVGELEMRRAPMGVWAAMESLRDGWIYRDDAAGEMTETAARRVA